MSIIALVIAFESKCAGNTTTPPGATMAPDDNMSNPAGQRTAAMSVDPSYVRDACATPLRCATIGAAFDSSDALIGPAP